MDVKQEMRERRVVDVLLPQFSHADESYSPLLGRAVNEIRLALRGDSSFSGSESSLSEVSSLRTNRRDNDVTFCVEEWNSSKRNVVLLMSRHGLL